MLERVTMPGIELPRLYIAENNADAELAMQKGVPFVRWKQGKEKLIATLLLPTLRKMFPHILWNKVGGLPRARSVIVERPGSGNTDSEMGVDAIGSASDNHAGDDSYVPNQEEVSFDSVRADDYRQFSNGPSLNWERVDVGVMMGDLSSQVNLDVLQNLKLMPKFIGDIMDCIKTNVVAGTLWSDGYNKKKGLTIGNYDRTGELRNLIILDVSGSIPVGISSTMIALVDTLRTQVHADLIITGSCSRYYPHGSELPSPQEIRNTIGRGNEAVEFNAILRDHIAGHHFGHVISFGDNDCPARWMKLDDKAPSLAGTKVEEVHHYHTHRRDKDTGYALWCNDLQMKPKVSHDTTWCTVISKS